MDQPVEMNVLLSASVSLSTQTTHVNGSASGNECIAVSFSVISFLCICRRMCGLSGVQVNEIKINGRKVHFHNDVAIALFPSRIATKKLKTPARNSYRVDNIFLNYTSSKYC